MDNSESKPKHVLITRLDPDTKQRETVLRFRYPYIERDGLYTTLHCNLADFEQLRDDLDRAIAWLKEGESNV